MSARYLEIDQVALVNHVESEVCPDGVLWRMGVTIDGQACNASYFDPDGTALIVEGDYHWLVGSWDGPEPDDNISFVTVEHREMKIFDPEQVPDHCVAEPARESFEIFRGLQYRIRSFALRQFLFECFLIPRVVERFFCAPASQENHHSFAGGLAVHSCEVGLLFLHQAKLAPTLSLREVEIGLVSCLVHDLGKVFSRSEFQAKEPRFWDEEASVCLMEAPLERLSQSDPEAARAIRYLVYGHRQNRHESGCLWFLVRTADRHSACCVNQSVAAAENVRENGFLRLSTTGPVKKYFALDGGCHEANRKGS